jgi:hypothetical protein
MIHPILKSLLVLLALVSLTSLANAQGADSSGGLNSVDQSELDSLEESEKSSRNEQIREKELENQDVFQEMKDSDQDIVIRQIDRSMGVFLEDYSTQKDQHRFGLNYHFNTDLKNPFEVTTLEANYAYRLGVAWLEFALAYTTGKYREMTRLNTSIAAETELQREENATNLTFGGGLGYRTRYIRDLINSQNIFETIAAYLTYNSFSDNFRAESYTGYGIKTDFGVHFRSGARSHYGVKFSYNLASVRKAQEFETQGSAARSLTLTWATFGLDYSFYF